MPDLAAKNYALRSAAEREATNAPLQGSAADLMKLAMVRIDRRLAPYGDGALMLLQIHDELIFDVRRDVLPAVSAMIKHEMETALELSVPIEATLKTGATWYDVQAFDPDDVAEPAAS
jgi:DNA polymerase-1